MNHAMKVKLDSLCRTIYKRDKTLPVLTKGSAEWWQWKSWRERHGLSTTFMEQQAMWTVPTELPPTDIDAALAESGPASKRLAT